MLACHISILLDCQGPSNTITEAEAAANLAIGEAARIIARGRADVMITGGADSKIHPLSLIRMSLLDQMSEWRGEPSRRLPPVRPQAERLGPRRGGGHPHSRRARALRCGGGPRSTASSSASARAATRLPPAASTPTESAPRSPSERPCATPVIDPGRGRPRQRSWRRVARLGPGRSPRLQPCLRTRRLGSGHRCEGVLRQHCFGQRRRRADHQPPGRQSRVHPDDAELRRSRSPVRPRSRSRSARPTANPVFLTTNLTRHGQAAALLIRGCPPERYRRERATHPLKDDFSCVVLS